MTTVINNTPKVKRFRYSEIFGGTFQGEGHFTGRPTAWLRMWGCNFNCSGFGQDNPRDPSTWVMDYDHIDVSKYSSMEELPVFHRGCDSSYSWASKFAQLSHQGTASEICSNIEAILPGGKFKHPVSGQWHHMAFTGGEPMMSQTALLDIMVEFKARKNTPRFVTIETNGTQSARKLFHDSFNPTGSYQFRTVGPETREPSGRDVQLFWSVSPKLSASGESWDMAIQPEVVADYALISNFGQLKFVVDGSDEVWQEVEEAVASYRAVGLNWDVWIMPVGADREMQESHQAVIAEQAVERGYSVAARVHTWVFGNVIGK